MAQTKNLGKVALTPRGVYSPGSSYEKLDVVTYSGSSWLCLQDVQGVTPTPGVYWMQLTSKGDTGATGQAATVAVGTVTTVSPSSPATVTNSGTANNAVFDFEIPQGTAGTVTTVDSVAAVGGNVALNAVTYGSVMSLNSTQQQNVRDSIGAAAASDLSSYVPTSDKGAANGVATLNSSSKVTPAQLYSPNVAVSANTNLSNYFGYTVFCSGTITLTIGTMTEGAEVVAWNTSTGTVTISGTLFVAGSGNKTSCKIDSYGCALLKVRSSRVYVSGTVTT